MEADFLCQFRSATVRSFQISVFELARTPYFGSLSLIPEDYIKDHGAKYSCKFMPYRWMHFHSMYSLEWKVSKLQSDQCHWQCHCPSVFNDVHLMCTLLNTGSEPDAVHVVVDRHVITGQNEESTLTAVQNLILLCNHR